MLGVCVAFVLNVDIYLCLFVPFNTIPMTKNGPWHFSTLLNISDLSTGENGIIILIL
jgi:hypothetical protein